MTVRMSALSTPIPYAHVAQSKPFFELKNQRSMRSFSGFVSPAW